MLNSDDERTTVMVGVRGKRLHEILSAREKKRDINFYIHFVYYSLSLTFLLLLFNLITHVHIATCTHIYIRILVHFHTVI